MLSKSFFLRPTLEVARDLIGIKISTNIRGRITSGMIVETEAYGKNDPACHAWKKRTARNEVMFWEGGHCYVYFIYGMYFCVNVVTEEEGAGCAVLLRAVQPLEGINLMKRRRKIDNERNLASGPGKLTQAFSIDKRMLGENLLSSNLISLESYENFQDRQIQRTPRIGISQAKDFPWRFFLKNSIWVSNARPG